MGQNDRNLTTGDVARLTGYTAKAVAGWADRDEESLPHDRRPGPGGSVRMFSRDDVERWTRSQGIEWKGQERPAGPDEPGELASLEEAAGLLDGQDGDGDQVEDDLESVVRTLRLLQSLIEKIEKSGSRLSPQAASQISRAMSSASGELRALRKERREQAEFDESMIPRDDAQSLAIAAVGMVVADLEALGQTLPRLVLAALDEASVTVSDRDRATRIIIETYGRASDEVRERRAAWIRSELGRDPIEVDPVEVES